MVMRRWLKADEEAVSEIVSTILTLAITVVLFSSVFATVTQMEGPDERYHLDFTTNFEYHNQTHYLNITHEGGKDLSTYPTYFNLLIDGVNHRYHLDHENVSLSGDDNSEWTIGEEVSIKGNFDIGINSTMELKIVDDRTKRLVYETTVLEKAGQIFDIRNSRIDYEESWRDHGVPGEEIKIRTEVVASVFKRNESFSPKDIWINASVQQSDVLEYKNGSSINPGDKIALNHVRESVFSRNLMITSRADHSNYRIKIIAETSNKSIEFDVDPSYIYLNVGKDLKQFYKNKLEIGDMWFNPGDPSHGGPFTVHAEVYNLGENDVNAKLKIKDDRQGKFIYDDEGDGFTISAGPAPTSLRAEYPNGILGHGPHEVNLKIEPMRDGWQGENKSELINVDPSVMIVGDSIPENQEETELMENALDGLNYESDTFSVELGETIPNLKSQLVNHSICIWMTGNRTENTDELYINYEGAPGEDSVLTKLDDYVEGNLRGSSALNGTLWFLGSNLEKIENNNIAFGELQNKLGLDFNVPDGPFGDSGSFGNEKLLSSLVKDKNGTYGHFTYRIDEGQYVEITDRKDEVNDTDTLQNEDYYYGLGYEKNYPDKNYTHKTVVNSFLFKSIADPGYRTVMVGEVIEWLSNMSTRQGIDFSVISQDITPNAPMYEKNVTITAMVRNNGPYERSVSVRAVRDDGEEILSPDGPGKISLAPNGGTDLVNFTWRANILGKHEFLVKVDYFNNIDEVNLINNDISYKNLAVTSDTIEVNVRYSTMLVDADGSENGFENVTGEVKESFDRLGYEEGKDYNYTQVKGDEGPEYGGKGGMQEYNAIYWVTGKKSGNQFTDDNLDDILEYLKQEEGANMLFMGKNILESLDSDDPKEKKLLEYMGIDPDSSIQDRTSSFLEGQKGNDLSHNLKYNVTKQSYSAFEKTTEDGEVLFKNEKGDNLASIHDTGNNKTVYMGVNLDQIIAPLPGKSAFDDWPIGDVDTQPKNAKDEFIFTSLWNFGKKEIRPEEQEPELRVSDYDIVFSNQHPETTHAYWINVTIENIGYEEASVLVRITDGQNYVASRNAKVGPSTRFSEGTSTYFEVEPGSATVEVPWEPLHSGTRSIKVKVDPLDQIDEKKYKTSGKEIMEFHNQAIVEHPVYYFYDDMENGTDKWKHDTTMMNVDGTSPLDFIGRENLDTNVTGEWAWDQSGSTLSDGTNVSGKGRGVYETDNSSIGQYTDNASYTPPRSYWMPECGEDDSGNSVSENIDKRDYRFMTTKPFRVGTAMLKFEAYDYGESEDDGYLGNVRIDYVNKYWWIEPGTDPDSTEDPHEGNMNEIYDGDATVEDGNLDEHPVAILNNPNNGTELWTPTIVDDTSDGGPITLHMQPIDGAINDFVIIWEDLHLKGFGSGDGDGDHWVRVTLLDSGEYRVNVFRAKGGFRHDFSIGKEHIYTKPRGETWTNIIGGEHYETDDAGLPKYQVKARGTTFQFRHKYWMDQHHSGGMLYLWGSDDEKEWEWNKDRRLYVKPRRPYSGAIDKNALANDADSGGPMNDTGLRDADGNLPLWAYNGKSGQPSFEWKSEKVDVLKQIKGSTNFSYRYVRVVFLSARFDHPEAGQNWNPERGWYVDNARLKLSAAWESEFSNWAHVTAEELNKSMGLDPTLYDNGIEDFYDHTLKNEKGHFWMFGGINANGKDYLPGGVDSSLYTDPIYLTNAENPKLTAYMKFNIDSGAGLPPDGFRVEISDDDGQTWAPLTLGARSAWNASGTDADTGEKFSGTTEDTDSDAYGWVNTDTLTRLEYDLSGWREERVIIRFRVFTNKSSEYDNEELPRSIFIDDVMVKEAEGDQLKSAKGSAPLMDDEKKNLERNQKKRIEMTPQTKHTVTDGGDTNSLYLDLQTSNSAKIEDVRAYACLKRSLPIVDPRTVPRKTVRKFRRS